MAKGEKKQVQAGSGRVWKLEITVEEITRVGYGFNEEKLERLISHIVTLFQLYGLESVVTFEEVAGTGQEEQGHGQE